MKEKLQHIETNDLYVVDSLTHSIPYLIKGAAQLLDTVLKPPFDEQKKRFLKLKENLQNDMNGGTVDTDYPTASGYNAQGNFPPAFIK